MNNSAYALLQPDFPVAANVEQALGVLHIGDSRVTQADRYLAGVRASPAAWPVCCAIIRSPDSSHAALMFAASAIHARTRADWLTFADDSHRMTAFNLALEGLCRARTSTSAATCTSSPLHFFGRSCGFCLSMAPSPNSRDLMWASLDAQLGCNPVFRCSALAAVVQEIDSTATVHVDTYVVMRSFCQSKARRVLDAAVSILNNIDPCPPENVVSMSVQDLKAGVLCLHAWQKYAERISITVALLKAIRVPQLASDVSETMTEIVGFSGSNVQLLMGTCDGLISAFQLAQGSPGVCTIHHAIAEVACSLSDGNADELLEQENKNSLVVAQKATQLLSFCLKSKDDRAFFASVQGWTSWITAANLVEQSHARVVRDQVASVVHVVAQRMKSLRFIADLVESEICGSETNDEMICIRDLLLEAAKSLGVAEYLKVAMPLFEAEWNESPHACCAALFSISVGGENEEELRLRAEDRDIVHRLLRRIMDLVESLITQPGSAGKGHKSVKVAAMSSLCSFASILSEHGSEAEFHRALRCVGTGMVDPDVSEKATGFLFELAEANPGRLTKFLAELVLSGTSAVPRMSRVAASNCVRSLSKVTATLESQSERHKAMDAILDEPCKHILWVRRQQKIASMEQDVCRSLGLISAGLQEVNDNEAALTIFARLRSAVFEIAVMHCANETVARAICRLLEVCVLPTLLDDEQPRLVAEERREQGSNSVSSCPDAGRIGLAMSCMSLAAECFRRSGKDGETVWLSAVAEISPHILECLEGGFGTEVEGRALACLTVSLQHALEGLQDFTGGAYDEQSEMAVAYFRFATRLLRGMMSAGAVVVNSSECARVGLMGVQCEDISVVREALLWWKTVFGPGLGEVATAVLSGAGGADSVARAFVCAARHTRCAGAVADALFALCKWVAQISGDGDPNNVLRACLTAAFRAEGVPSLGLDAKVREMLYRSCMNSTGSMRDFRQALREFGRVYSLALMSK